MYFILLILFPLYSLRAQVIEPGREYPLLDRTHALFTENLDALANRVDVFFATERADDEFARSSLRIRSSYEIREDAKGESNLSYRLNFRIPQLEKRLKEGARKLIPPRKAQDNSESAPSPPPRSKSGWFFNADAQVIASIPPKLVVRSRLRKNIIFSNWSHRFAEELTYITERDGLSEKTSFESDYRLSENVLLRLSNVKSWQVLSKQLTTQHGPSIIHQFSARDAFNYSLFAQTLLEEEGPFYLENYRLSARYRRDIYKNWMFLDSTLGIDFPKHYSFRRNPFALILLEILFGS